jgi:hypothetical protein
MNKIWQKIALSDGRINAAPLQRLLGHFIARKYQEIEQ